MKKIEKVKYLNYYNERKDQGITLVALVVTIIILLILTGVTLNIALSDNGLFEKAKDAVEKYKKAEEDEENSLNKLAEQLEDINIDYSKYVGAQVTGYDPETKTCKIEPTTSGHTEEQDFTTEENLSWRVWNYDGKTLTIIGDPTIKTLTLNGAAGYNNGAWAINEICKECYSNTAIGVEATSLKRSDIQKTSNYDYTQYKHNESGDNAWKEVIDDSSSENLIYFGESKTYTNGNARYPEMWEENDKNWEYICDSETKKSTGKDKECTTWENIGNGKMGNTMKSGEPSTTTYKQSFYEHSYKETEFSNKKYYYLIFKKSNNDPTGAYWLPGRFMLLTKSWYDFGLQRVSSSVTDGLVGGFTLCNSSGEPKNTNYSIRPIVSINLRETSCTMKPTIIEDGYVQKCELSWNS